jgi:hypothetical protein
MKECMRRSRATVQSILANEGAGEDDLALILIEGTEIAANSLWTYLPPTCGSE